MENGWVRFKKGDGWAVYQRECALRSSDRKERSVTADDTASRRHDGPQVRSWLQKADTFTDACRGDGPQPSVHNEWSALKKADKFADFDKACALIPSIGDRQTAAHSTAKSAPAPAPATTLKMDNSSKPLTFAQLCNEWDLVRANASEDDKIAAAIFQSTVPFRDVMGKPEKRPPRDYTCHICGDSAHFVRDCPHKKTTSHRERSSHGIPKSFMVPVRSANCPGAMKTAQGTYAVPRINAYAYLEACGISRSSLQAPPPPPPSQDEYQSCHSLKRKSLHHPPIEAKRPRRK